MKCRKCGREISTESKFCMFCGAGVSTDTVMNRAFVDPQREMRSGKGVSPNKNTKKLNSKDYALIFGLGGGLLLVGAVFYAFLFLQLFSGVFSSKKYTCSDCGKEVRVAYYDPYDEDAVMCEDCAREYFAPFSYEAFRIRDR